MLPFETTLAFFGVSLLLALAPGPDNLFVLMQSATRGTRAGMLVVLGLCTGLLVHTTAVALGLSALIAASPGAFTLLKLAGAGYLVFLAVQAFRTRRYQDNAAPLAPAKSAGVYGRGIVMSVTNPKVGLFFLAFLPQFTRADLGNVPGQILWLGFIFALATWMVFGAIAYFAGRLGSLLQRYGASLNWMAGAVFLGLALRLAWP